MTSQTPRVDEVIINEELARRPSRSPDFGAESRALVALAEVMADSPEAVLQKLADVVLELCGAGSAGVSIEEPGGGGVFRWQATAGAYAPYLGGTMPRGFSPCGTVLDRNGTLLMADPARFYNYVSELTPSISEVLLIPFYRGAAPVGTIWAVAHTDEKRFDAEDVRLLGNLTRFAAAAVQTLAALDEEKRTKAELLRLGEVGRAADGRAVRILESVTDAFFAVDHDWRFTYLNPQAEPLLQRDRGGLLGKVLWEEFPAAIGTDFEREYRSAMAERRPATFEGYYPAPLDAWYEVHAYPSEDGLSVYFRDVTGRRRSEAVLADQKHILELVAGGSPLGRVLDALCRMVEGHSGSTLLASVLILDGGGRLRHGGAPSLPEAYNRAIDGIVVGPRVGSCGSAVHRREPVFVSDIATDPLWADFAELALSHDLRACWSIPIVSAEGEILGTFAMYHRNPRSPNPEDLHLVDIVTRTAAIAIERERSEGDRRQRALAAVRRGEQLQKLADIANRINSARDVDSVLGVVTEEARSLFDAHRAATIMVPDPRHPQPVNVASNSAKDPRGSPSPDVDASGFYEAIRLASGPIRLTRAGLDSDPRWRALAPMAGFAPSLNGWLAAPLVGRDGGNMGLLQLSDRAEGDFTEDDEAILVQLSRLAGIAIENARLYQELRTNDERKDEFLAMLAHELRNPLAAIGNAVKLASRTDAREQLDWSMGVITRQMQHLSRLIDDLMDVSRITRGKIALKRAVMDATPILESAAATVETLVEERKHTLEAVIDRGNLWVDVDPTRLEQVVVNLLNNAAKYSENGGHILLSARTEGGEVVIRVKDRGVGIPPARLPEMFELFAQGDRSLARSEGGLGIGLTVVKKLVEMHGGGIAAWSEGPGKGSEFVIRLPAARKPAKVPRKREGPPDRPARRARILVVDDSVDTARGMARLLRLIGHEVTTAHTGPDAIERAREHRPDFVLLDIGLPGMSGYEVAAQLRREECGKGAVIVAISGYGQDEDRRRSKSAGFDFHLTKPLDHDALLTLISAGND